VIDNEAQFRLRMGGLKGGGKLADPNEQVIGEARTGKLPQPTLHLVPQ
jgi:hypothetical protein